MNIIIWINLERIINLIECAWFEIFIYPQSFCPFVSCFQFRSSQNSNIIISICKARRKMINSNDFTRKILVFSKKKGNLFAKFAPNNILTLLDAHQLNGLQLFIQKEKCITIQNFVAYLATNVQHKPEQTLFFICGLCEFYEQIKKKNNVNSAQPIKLTQLTDFIYEAISDTHEQTILPLNQNSDGELLTSLKSQKYPTIRFQVPPSLPIMTRANLKKDKTLKKPLSQLIIAQNMNKILVLGKLASYIQLYSNELKLCTEIRPSISEKLKKQLPILSVGYSKDQQRIGCVLKSVGLVFWEAADGFQTEKIMEGVIAQQIMYIQSLSAWITSDKCSVCIWELQSEKCVRKIEIENGQYISCIYEINQLKLVLISVILKDSRKKLICYRIKNHQISILCEVTLPSSGCHTMAYNETTKTLAIAGFSNLLEVRNPDVANRQMNCIFTLKGHKDVITTITNVKNTSMVISGDDYGFIRLWDLKSMRCIQALKISQQIRYLGHFRDQLIFCDKRINITHIDMPQTPKKNKVFITHFYDERLQNLYVINSSECHVVDMQTGKLKEVNVICTEEEQIYTAKRIKASLFFGTNKGNLYCLDPSFKQKKTFKIKDSDLSQIVEDSNSLCVIFSGSDGKMNVWMQNSDFEEKAKKCRVNLGAETFLLGLQLYQPDALIVAATQSKIFFIDFESMKIEKTISCPFNISKIKFLKKHPVLIVLSDKMQVFALSFKKVQACLTFVHKNILKLPINRHSSEVFTDVLQTEPLTIFLGTNKGHLYKIDIRDLIIELGILSSNRTFLNKSANIFRPAQQKNDLSSHSNCVLILQDFKLSETAILGSQQITHSSIVEINNFINQSSISIMSQDGQIFFVNFDTLEVVAERSMKYAFPFKWCIFSPDTEKIKSKIKNSLEIVEKIYQKQFNETQKKMIHLQNIELDSFLAQIIQDKEISDHQNFFNEKQKIRITHKRRSYTTQAKHLSLKSMQISKRILKMKEKNEKTVSKNIRKRGATAQDHIYIEFVKPNYRDRFHKHSKSSDIPCELYQRIQDKYKALQESNKILRTVSNNFSSSRAIKFRGIHETKEKLTFEGKSSKSIRFNTNLHIKSSLNQHEESKWQTRKKIHFPQDNHRNFLKNLPGKPVSKKRLHDRNFWNRQENSRKGYHPSFV